MFKSVLAQSRKLGPIYRKRAAGASLNGVPSISLRHFWPNLTLAQDAKGMAGKMSPESPEQAPGAKKAIGQIKVDKPMLMIAFTCKKCNTRSSHSMSKQAYTNGTVLIQCPGCKGRHLIADHLKIFSDDHVTIQDILKAKGESVSQTTDDLAFEDIPDNLKSLIGHHAKDAPRGAAEKSCDHEKHILPEK
ncbi:LAMI_0G07030g1_1 [Lachancea mirantina]|uniref:LAMI_0G07030g1_1 n=1 Tax=Lachancea mirantina TaxID=1230905 RepID=A0A1G4K9G9_9SACH|nr:LAMI_0G07030g1_1 [Lachancea mirantina]